MIHLQCRSVICQKPSSPEIVSAHQVTYVVSLILGEHVKELVQEDHKMGRHFIQLVQVAIGVGITESSADRLINKEQVGELIPRTLVVFQCLFVLESVGANLHQRAIHRAASGPTI